MNSSETVVILLVSVVSAMSTPTNGIDLPENQTTTRDEEQSATTTPTSTTPKKSYLRMLMTNISDDEEGSRDEKSDTDTKNSAWLDKIREPINEAAEITYPDEISTIKSSKHDNHQSESADDVENQLLPLNQRLDSAMSEALKELVAENILEASSSTTDDSAENSHTLKTDIARSSSIQRPTDDSNDECPASEKDASDSASFPQRTNGTPKSEHTKQSASRSEDDDETSAPSRAVENTNDEALALPPASESESAEASVEGESSTPSQGRTKKMSYALALLSSPAKVIKKVETERVKPDADESLNRMFPTLSEARARKGKARNKIPDDSPVELFCPAEEEREAIQTDAVAANLRYNANRRHVLIMARQPRVDVFGELQRMRIDAGSFGVRTTVLLPSGAVLFKFETEEGTRRLHDTVTASGVFRVRSTRSATCQVRIHGIPVQTSKAEVYYDIYLKYGAIPQKVRFTKDDRAPDDRGLSLAIIEVSEDLLQKISASPDIRIRWRARKIETSVRMFRCSNCYTLGHRSEFCRLFTRPPPSIYEECIDCRYHNQCSAIVGHSVHRNRDTDHRTDDNDLCLSKRNQIAKLEEKYEGRKIERRPLLI